MNTIRPSIRGGANRRGIALVMVLAVVAVAFILSGGYMVQQAVSVQIDRNMANRAQARVIAESGLEMALSYVRSDANWRTARTPGNWVQNVSYGGGTVTINAQAGLDPNGSGNIVGDGSFTANTSEPVTLAATAKIDGAAWTARAVAIPPASTRVTSGVIVSTTVTISGGSLLDSYDSTLGPYGSGNSGSNAHVATNSTQAGAVSLSGGVSLKGSVYAGPGANVANVVSNNYCTYTGTTTAMAAAVPIPAITIPNLGAPQSAVTYGYGTATLSQNLHTTSLMLNGGGKLRISGNVVVVTDGAFSIGNGGTLEVLPNSSLKVYCSGVLTLNGGSTSSLGVDGQNLDRLTLYNMGTTTATLSNGSVMTGVLVSPNAPVSVTGGFNLCGAVIARSLTIDNGSFFHEDTRITNGTDPVTLSTSGTYTAKWVK